MTKLYSINTVAELCDVSRMTVYRWFDKGLKKTYVEGVLRIKEEDLQKFIEGGE